MGSHPTAHKDECNCNEYTRQIKNEILPIVTFYCHQPALELKYQILVEKYSSPESILKHILRIKVTLSPNMFIVCTFTDLIDWANKGQPWTVKGHWCSVLRDRLSLDSFLFFCHFSLDQPSLFLFSLLFSLVFSFLLGGLSFLFPRFLSFYQTPSRIRPFLTCSAKNQDIL